MSSTVFTTNRDVSERRFLRHYQSPVGGNELDKNTRKHDLERRPSVVVMTIYYTITNSEQKSTGKIRHDDPVKHRPELISLLAVHERST